MSREWADKAVIAGYDVEGNQTIIATEWEGVDVELGVKHWNGSWYACGPDEERDATIDVTEAEAAWLRTTAVAFDQASERIEYLVEGE